MTTTRTKFAASVAILLAGWGVMRIVGAGTVGTIASADIAGLQLRNSDAAQATYAAATSALHGASLWIGLATLGLIALVWLMPRRVQNRVNLVALAGGLALATPAQAYFDTSDKTEATIILPNESAFWVPETGNSVASQSNTDSEQYYAANKVQARRFVIPHAKLQNTGGWYGFDAYVPTGRLIVVDRSPYYREWTKSSNRGSSTADQSIPCQTQEGINVGTEVGISASVTEQAAPKFLATFGVNNPAGDRGDPKVIFTSVYYGRSLTQVMDTIGRGFVHTLVCREIGARTFDKANQDINQIMQSVQTETTKFLADRGVTLEYIGWAGTWTYDGDVQRAINDRYSGEHVGPVLSQLQAKATVDAIENWDHRLPGWVSLSQFPGANLGDAVASFLRPTPPPPAAATAAK